MGPNLILDQTTLLTTARIISCNYDSKEGIKELADLRLGIHALNHLRVVVVHGTVSSDGAWNRAIGLVDRISRIEPEIMVVVLQKKYISFYRTSVSKKKKELNQHHQKWTWKAPWAGSTSLGAFASHRSSRICRAHQTRRSILRKTPE